MQPGVEMNAGFTAALAGLAEAPLSWERCSQLDEWVRTRLAHAICHQMPLLQFNAFHRAPHIGLACSARSMQRACRGRP